MLDFMRDVYLLNRTIVGPGYDAALARVGEELELTVHEVASGEDAWTWRVPDAWDVKEAYFTDGERRFADVAEHPLHVWSHSLPFRGRVSREELLEHLTTNPKRPGAVPFDFRYYERRWGFCLAHDQLAELTADEYDVVIETEEGPGALKVGEHVIPGRSEDSILLVAHLCHPGQANDDLAGVAVAVEAAKRLAGGDRHHTIRVLFLPEHIGSAAYLSRHEHLLDTFRYAIFLEMLGIDQPHALQYSKQGDTAIDKAIELALRERADEPYVTGGFMRVICNDEQVLNGPGVGIPTPSLSRAQPTTLDDTSAYPRFVEGLPYAEYHTSDDSMEIIDPAALEGSVQVVVRALEILEQDATPVRQYRGTVQLSRYGLWVDWRIDPELNEKIDHFMWSFEGDKTLMDIAKETGLPFATVRDYVERFRAAGLVELHPAIRESASSSSAPATA